MYGCLILYKWGCVWWGLYCIIEVWLVYCERFFVVYFVYFVYFWVEVGNLVWNYLMELG